MAILPDEMGQLRSELDESRARLAEAKDALDSIFKGEVDGLVAAGPEGSRVFSLHGAQEPYQLIIEQMSEGAATLSHEGIILYANQAFARMLKIPLEHVIGEELRTFIIPGDQSVIAEMVEEAWNGSSRGEIYVNAADDSFIPVRLGLNRLQINDMTLVCVVATDLTLEKKKAELSRQHDDLEKRVNERTNELAASRLAALNMMDDAIAAREKAEAVNRNLHREMTERKRAEESQALLATAVEQSAEAIIVTDPDAVILYVNPAFEKISGFTRDEVIGRNTRIFKSGKHEKGFYRDMWATLEAGEVWTGKIINKRKDGTFYEATGTISPVRNAAGRLINYVAVRRDITHETQLEAQLLQSQKMETVGNLAGGIAHDFNNILTAMMANVDLITAEGHFSPQIKEYLSETRNALNLAAKLTSQLLAFSRRQILQPVRVDLNQVVSHMGSMLRRLLGAQVALEIRLAPEPVPVLADVAQMEQVLMNLCVNARDAMPGGGNLTIAIRSVDLEGLYSSVAESIVPAGRYACIEITDTGIGMDAELLSRIFEPFYTTKEQGKGTGLGLSMVYGIMKQHRGHVFAYSEPGRGTSFKLSLPWLEDEGHEGTIETAPAIKETVLGGEETILVAEDEAAVARGIKRTLERQGYTVIHAHDGQEAVEIFEREHDHIDLVILDAVMPRMGGKEASIRIAKLKPDQRCLFTSGYAADTGVVDDKFMLPADGHFIQKPYGASDLARAVRKALDSPPPPGPPQDAV